MFMPRPNKKNMCPQKSAYQPMAKHNDPAHIFF